MPLPALSCQERDALKKERDALKKELEVGDAKGSRKDKQDS